jgi:ribosomal protein L11 methyltransferase
VPYRVDSSAAAGAALDRLIDLGALDLEVSRDGRIAALMPDSVSPDEVIRAVGVVTIAPAVGRDADSVWILRPRPIRVGRIRIVPADIDAEPGDIRLIDAPAFGTGLHPTTRLCLEALADIIQSDPPDSLLDVGTGSGVLALAALTLGVPRAHGIDIDEGSLQAAADNARINGLDGRLRLARGSPDAVTGAWPLVVANVLAAPLIEMGPWLVQRVGRRGRLVLSGIPRSVEGDVHDTYRRLGMRRMESRSREGWVALVLHATW